MNKEKEHHVRKQRSISHASYRNHAQQLQELVKHLPPVFSNSDSVKNDDFQPLNTQVAGHRFVEGKETIGMLKCKNGTVLKPITKTDLGNREIRFYEQLQTTTNASLIELKEYCPNYQGTRMLNVNDKSVEFIILENITESMLEPCIIDIKIGKVTWDPLATAEKISKEKEKYAECKNDVAFCIPGFQVHKISTGRLHRYNKEYGKKLNGETVKEALKIFLNADSNRALCRELIVKLLSSLWKIQKWAKTQRSINLYSTSLLIAYDCKKLKDLVKDTFSYKEASHQIQKTRKVSFNSPESYSKDSTGHFSGQISESGPILKLRKNSNVLMDQQFAPNTNTQPKTEGILNWHKAYQKINRSHSFHHNYKDFITRVKTDYASTLKELINDETGVNAPWFVVKIIDFAHTFPMEEPAEDINYTEGIDNLVKIFESFLETAK